MRKTALLLCACCTFFAWAAVAVAGSITKPYTFANGAPADANQVNANFDTVYQQTNRNSSDIAVAVRSVNLRKVIVSRPYNATNYIGSEVPNAACGAGEVLTGGSCSCTHDSFSAATTNYGLVWTCDFIGNSVLGMCGANSTVMSTYKFGPPITVTAVCASVTPVGSSLAKTTDYLDPHQAEREAAVERMKKEQAELIRVLKENNSQ